MLVLVTNDDGVNAPGIKVLAQSLATFCEIKVVAPDRDRSAASHSLTLDMPLRAYELDNGFVSINGTPTDCVHLAITGYMDVAPDMVVSGINAGANLGDDVLYSGTVAAAIEGRTLGYPTVAISLCGTGNLMHYQTAGFFAQKIVQQLMGNPLRKEMILNVNVPDLPISEIKGIQVTRLGYRHRAAPMTQGVDPRGNTVYWVSGAGPGADAGVGTDFHAIQEGYVSVTPIKTDLTDKEQLTVVKEWFSSFTM